MARAKKNLSRLGAQRVLAAIQASEHMRGLTPTKLVRALEDFKRGYLRDAARLWDQIRERDDTTLAVTEKRDLEASLLEWEILAVDDSAAAKQHQAALQAAYNALTATHVMEQDRRGGVSTLVRQMMHAVGHKWAVFEIVWDPTGPDLTAEFRFVPLQFFEHTTGKLRYLASEGAQQGEDLEEGGWMVVCGPGLMVATSIAYLLKRQPLQAWAILCDKFAVPYLHGETPAAKGSPEWDDFVSALAGFVSDGAVVTSPGTKITPIQITGAEAPAATLVDRMDRAVSRIWRGADLGTMSRDGSAVGANPQETETDILNAADAQMISEALNAAFDRPLLAARFGAEPLAYFKLKPRVRVNQALQVQIDDALIRWGVPRAKANLLEAYGRPAPAAGEELATAPAAAPGLSTLNSQLSTAGLANEAGAALTSARFSSAARRRILAAKAQAFAPLANRVETILAIEDDSARRDALQQLQADLPRYVRTAGVTEVEVAAWSEALGTALVSGAAEAAQDRPAPPVPVANAVPPAPAPQSLAIHLPAAPSPVINYTPPPVTIPAEAVKLDITLHQPGTPARRMVRVAKADGSLDHYRAEDVPSAPAT